MKKEKASTKICKHCKTEIDAKAKVCPQCRKKQGMGLIPKVFIVIVIIALLGSFAGSDDDSSSSDNNVAQDKQETTEYKQVSVAEMMNTLDSNAAKASKEYKGQYLEISGTLEVIDSDLAYISVHSGEDFTIIGVTCYLKNDTQKDQVLEMEIGDEIVVQGKCTDVGEVFGYSLNVDNIK